MDKTVNERLVHLMRVRFFFLNRKTNRAIRPTHTKASSQAIMINEFRVSTSSLERLSPTKLPPIIMPSMKMANANRLNQIPFRIKRLLDTLRRFLSVFFLDLVI